MPAVDAPDTTATQITLTLNPTAPELVGCRAGLVLTWGLQSCCGVMPCCACCGPRCIHQNVWVGVHRELSPLPSSFLQATSYRYAIYAFDKQSRTCDSTELELRTVAARTAVLTRADLIYASGA